MLENFLKHIDITHLEEGDTTQLHGNKNDRTQIYFHFEPLEIEY